MYNASMLHAINVILKYNLLCHCNHLQVTKKSLHMTLSDVLLSTSHTTEQDLF